MGGEAEKEDEEEDEDEESGRFCCKFDWIRNAGPVVAKVVDITTSFTLSSRASARERI